MGRLSRYQQQAIQSAVDRIKKAQAYLMRISEQAPETRYLSFAMGDLQQVMEIDQQRKAKKYGQQEKYLLLKHSDDNFMDYTIEDTTHATNYPEACKELMQKHGLQPDDLRYTYTVISQSNYISKF